MEAILRNNFLDVSYVNVLRSGFKLRVIARLANRSISLDDAFPSP
jgi:hypothetical protein